MNRVLDGSGKGISFYYEILLSDIVITGHRWFGRAAMRSPREKRSLKKANL